MIKHNSNPVCRFIPAPAGNGKPRRGKATFTTVHPRACGERLYSGCVVNGVTGSSPRLRGTVEEQAREQERKRFIPAPAGNGGGASG